MKIDAKFNDQLNRILLSLDCFWIIARCQQLCFSCVTVGQDHSDLVADLLKELSNHNERSEERKGALVELLKITREDSLAVWDEHFKTILLLLLETLGDKDVRRLSLSVCVCASVEVCSLSYDKTV